MSTSQTSFSDRLARIETQRAVDAPSGHGGGTPPPSGPGRPRGSGGGGGRGLRIALSMAVSFLVVAGVAFVWLFLSSEQSQMGRMADASEAEITGNSNLFTKVINSGGGADAGISLAVRKAEKLLESGTLSPDKERRTQAFIKENKGVSAAEKARGNLAPMIRLEAEMAGQPAMGEAALLALDACTSTTCLAYVQAKFQANLRAAKGG